MYRNNREMEIVYSFSTGHQHYASLRDKQRVAPSNMIHFLFSGFNKATP